MQWPSVYVLSLTLTLAVSPSPTAWGQEPTQLDWVLTGGRILDGTGNPWFHGDVGVANGRVVAIGDLTDAPANRRLDVTGKIVAPGFIDMHSHADGPEGERNGLRAPEPMRRAAHNLVAQGITTVVVNQDGGSPQSLADQRRQLEEQGHGPNVLLLVGHNSIRRDALGDDHERLATEAELGTMIAALERGIAEGAAGLSTGLEYVPARWSDTEEVVALASVLKRTGGVFVVHERASGSDPMWFWPSRDEPGAPTMLDSIIETIEVARQTGVPTIATHVKARGADFWGSGTAILQLIRRARAQGVEVWLDQYPYDSTGSDGRTVLLPPWSLMPLDGSLDRGRSTADQRDDEPPPDYAARLESRLEDPLKRDAIARDVAREIQRRGGAERLVVMEHPNEDFVGKSLAQLTLSRERVASTDALVSTAISLQLEGDRTRPGGARIRGFSLSELDVESMAAADFTLTASDAGIALEKDGPVHARFYGTYPRKIRHYAIERGVLDVASAVRSSTSLPAQVLRLTDRGTLREGARADIVVLDLERLSDRATFFEPHQYPVGVDWVFINGTAVVEEGVVTGALPGTVITLEETRWRPQAP